MKLFGAGMEYGARRKEHLELCLKYKVHKLFSYLNDRKALDIFKPAEGFVIVDSGAFTWLKISDYNMPQGKKSLSDLPDAKNFCRAYIKYIIEECPHDHLVFVEFDAYEFLTQDYCDSVYADIKAAGKAHRFIRVYHPRLDGGTLNVLRKWVGEGQHYIGVAQDSRRQGLLPDIFKITRDKVKLHGFALMYFETLLQQLPFYSVDSLITITPSMYGGTAVYERGKPFAKFYGNTNALKQEKKAQGLLPREEKVEMIIKELKYAEKYFTDLWRERGIVWDDKDFKLGENNGK